MNRSLASLLSVVFHPLLMPTLLFFLLLYLVPADLFMLPAANKQLLLAVVFVTTYVIPGFSTYLLYRMGAIKTLAISDRSERRVPFFYVTIFYCLTTWLFYRQLSADALLVQIMMIITVSLAVTAFITFFWKISAHGVGLGGVMGILMVLNARLSDNALLFPIIGMVVIAGLVLSARLALQEHNLAQVALGFLTGLTSGLCLGLFL